MASEIGLFSKNLSRRRQVSGAGPGGLRQDCIKRKYFEIIFIDSYFDMAYNLR